MPKVKIFQYRFSRYCVQGVLNWFKILQKYKCIPDIIKQLKGCLRVKIEAMELQSTNIYFVWERED